MGVRRNILSSPQARDSFLDGVLDLSERMTGIMASDLYGFLRNISPTIRMAGTDQELSYYDLLVAWHAAAMRVSIPPGNAAHSAPVFLPWHRMYLLVLEQWIQAVLGDPDFGLPYWDWAEDGELPQPLQWRTDLWTSDHLGEARGDVMTGRVGQMRVRLWSDEPGTIWSIPPRRLTREAGSDSLFRSLPTRAHVTSALQEQDYDRQPWSGGSSLGGHRNHLEGWLDGPRLHNRVHVWIGGDMGPRTSPNDPAFFLNHCNVDRIWEAWMGQQGRTYRPLDNEGPAGHRINDTMFAILGQAFTPGQVLDVSASYTYDNLNVD